MDLQTEHVGTETDRETPKAERDTDLVPKSVNEYRSQFERAFPRRPGRKGFFKRDKAENGYPTLGYLL